MLEAAAAAVTANHSPLQEDAPHEQTLESASPPAHHSPAMKKQKIHSESPVVEQPLPSVSHDSLTECQAAARHIAKGGLVAFPTETVYGLGARADDDQAVGAIYTAKGRPRDHPLIVHVCDIEGAKVFAAEWPCQAQRLAAAFWPGPVTVIVPRNLTMGAAAAGGQATIALRCPAHPIALKLLQEAVVLGVAGIAAPSANRFGRVSPTSAKHVRSEFEESVMVLDGGECEVGIESAIIDCTRGRAVLLRPGALCRKTIEAALEEPLHDPDTKAPRAPGTLVSHYAPTARVHLMSTDELTDQMAHLSPDRQSSLAAYTRTLEITALSHWRRMPMEAAAAAHELFAALRDLDAPGVVDIWVESPPTTSEWEGVNDRLRRAAS